MRFTSLSKGIDTNDIIILAIGVHGALIVEDNLFTRKCRCDFEVTVDSNKGTYELQTN